MMLKAEVKGETTNELRCAHGMCPPTTPLSWREIWKTISQKDPVYGLPDRWGYQNTVKYRYRWISLLAVNPVIWRVQIREWKWHDDMGAIMAEEIRKEIDAEVIAKIVALAKQ